MNKLVDLLKGIYLFEKFSADELKKIANITQKNVYSPGDVIFSEGEKAECMYFIEFGSIKLIKNSDKGEQEVGILGSGAHFGELPFIDELERALGVEAVEKSTLYEISYSDLRKELNNDHKMANDFYFEVSHFLATRLRRVTLDLSFVRELNLKHF